MPDTIPVREIVLQERVFLRHSRTPEWSGRLQETEVRELPDGIRRNRSLVDRRLRYRGDEHDMLGAQSFSAHPVPFLRDGVLELLHGQLGVCSVFTHLQNTLLELWQVALVRREDEPQSSLKAEETMGPVVPRHADETFYLRLLQDLEQFRILDGSLEAAAHDPFLKDLFNDLARMRRRTAPSRNAEWFHLLLHEEFDEEFAGAPLCAENPPKPLEPAPIFCPCGKNIALLLTLAHIILLKLESGVVPVLV